MRAWKRMSLLVAALLVASLFSFIVPVEAAPGDLPTKALQRVSRQSGIPVDQLSIVNRERARFPLQRMELVEFKVLARDGRTFGASFDAVSTNPVDATAVAQREQQLRLEQYGVIAPELYERLAQAKADTERIPVAIWARELEAARPDAGERDPMALAGDDQALHARAQELARGAQAPVVEAVSALGVSAAPAEVVPVVFAEMTPNEIKTLAANKSIAAIEGVPQDLQTFNDDLGTSDRFTYIWPTSTGSGAIVAVHENDGVDTTNTSLINPTYWCTGVNTGPGGTACTIGQNVGSHATNVAGVIVSTHPWRRGGAWGVGSLLSANFQSFGNAQAIVNSLTWALGSGADVVNMSWGGCTSGTPNFYSRVVDYLVKIYHDNLVVSSGNIPNCGGSTYVASPSLGWNTISVGSYWDSDTGLRTDDVFSNFTEWQNPTDPNSGRTYEKPDITAMGGQTSSTGTCFGVETTGVGASTFNSTCGTSFSAPDAAGLAALIVGRSPANFRNRTEVVKAILMAGATHNITDNAGYRDCPSSPVASDCRDGAGAIDAAQTINNIVNPGNWRYPGYITPASFNASGNIDYPVTLTAGQRMRVALAWDATATCTNVGAAAQSCSNDVLNADLDLHLVNSAGTAVATSSSFQNSAEVLDYVVPASGSYTIRIRRFRFDAGTNTFAGLAWNLNTTDSFTPLTGVTAMALNTTLAGQTTNLKASYWDKYSVPGVAPAGCWTWVETGLEKVYRVTTTTAGTLSATISNVTGFPGVSTDLDVFILKATGSANTLNTQGVACGNSVATATAQPAGTYYIVVDGYQGAVANYSLTVNFN